MAERRLALKVYVALVAGLPAVALVIRAVTGSTTPPWGWTMFS